MRRLTQLKRGETAVVQLILIDGAMRRRLQDIGLVEGTQVSKVLSAPSGNPSAYMIKGAVIALRAIDAEKIVIGG